MNLNANLTNLNVLYFIIYLRMIIRLCAFDLLILIKFIIMIETASFTGFIKVIFYLILFYYVFKFLARIFLPILLKKAVQKASDNFTSQQQSYNSAANTRETFRSTSNQDKPKESKKVGEYVDFEEIE